MQLVHPVHMQLCCDTAGDKRQTGWIAPCTNAAGCTARLSHYIQVDLRSVLDPCSWCTRYTCIVAVMLQVTKQTGWTPCTAATACAACSHSRIEECVCLLWLRPVQVQGQYRQCPAMPFHQGKQSISSALCLVVLHMKASTVCVPGLPCYCTM